MSKMDNQRAMREAKWARTQAAAAARRPAGATADDAPVAPRDDASPAAAKKRSVTKPVTPATASETDALCGHSSMNGRTCTRPAGHSEKSHRYG